MTVIVEGMTVLRWPSKEALTQQIFYRTERGYWASQGCLKGGAQVAQEPLEVCWKQFWFKNTICF